MNVLIPHYRALVAVLRSRLDEVHAPYAEIEAAVRLPDRYLPKLLGSPPLKLLHPYMMFELISALGMRLIMVEETPAASLVFARKKKMRAKPSMRGVRGLYRTPDEFRRAARQGGFARAAKLTPRRRRALARRAARARWLKWSEIKRAAARPLKPP